MFTHLYLLDGHHCGDRLMLCITCRTADVSGLNFPSLRRPLGLVAAVTSCGGDVGSCSGSAQSTDTERFLISRCQSELAICCVRLGPRALGASCPILTAQMAGWRQRVNACALWTLWWQETPHHTCKVLTGTVTAAALRGF